MSPQWHRASEKICLVLMFVNKVLLTLLGHDRMLLIIKGGSVLGGFCPGLCQGGGVPFYPDGRGGGDRIEKVCI